MNRANGLTGIKAALAATSMLSAAVFVLPATADTDPKAVITTYADIALAGIRGLADDRQGARRRRSTR